MKFFVTVTLFGFSSCAAPTNLTYELEVPTHEECVQKSKDWLDLPFVVKTDCSTLKE